VPSFDVKDGKPAGDLTADGNVAERPYGFEDLATRRPMLLMVTHDIAKGGSAALVSRVFEPPITQLGPLPNLVQIAPTSTTPPKP